MTTTCIVYLIFEFKQELMRRNETRELMFGTTVVLQLNQGTLPGSGGNPRLPDGQGSRVPFLPACRQTGVP